MTLTETKSWFFMLVIVYRIRSKGYSKLIIGFTVNYNVCWMVVWPSDRQRITPGLNNECWESTILVFTVISAQVLIWSKVLPRRQDQETSRRRTLMGWNRRQRWRNQKIMNTDVSCNTVGDLPAVETELISCRSPFSVLEKLLVTAPWPPVESLVEEAEHTDTPSEQMACVYRQVRQSL